MTANEALILALEMGRHWLLGLVKDLKDDELIAPPTATGGNHPLWVIGHLAVSEAGIVNGYVLGKENPLKSWEPTYGMGSTPTANPADYASIETLLARLDEVRQSTTKVLGDLSADDLEATTGADHEFFNTKGKCFAMLVSHQAFHTGQIADVRRTLGKKPVLA